MTDDVTQVPQSFPDGGRRTADRPQNGDSPAAGTPSPDHAADTPKRPSSFGDVAKTIRSRTTDLLAIAILIIGGLAVGSRVSGWWNTDESDAGNPVHTAESSAGRSRSGFAGPEPVRLDFGNSRWSLRRSVFTGSRAEASSELLTRCRQVAENTHGPQMPLEKAERRLLARLADAEPVETTSNGCNVYRADGPVMMASVAGPATSRSGRRDTGTAQRPQRVLCWGLMFPASEGRWVCYVFVPSGDGPQDFPSVSHLPRPPGALPVLTIRSGGGDLTQTYRTDRSPASVRAFYQKWAEPNNWKPVAAASHRNVFVYQKTTEHGRLRAEVNLARSAEGKLTCSVFVHRVRGKE